jgi:hypothetical protein
MSTVPARAWLELLNSPNEFFSCASQGCQICLGTKYQDGKNIPKYHELHQMSIKYNKRSSVHKIYNNIFHCKALRNVLKFGFFI